MFSTRTTRFGAEYGDRILLLEACSVTRKPNLGVLMRDNHVQDAARRPADERVLRFGPVHARVLSEVVLNEDYVLHDSESLYIDNSVLLISASQREDVQRIADKYHNRLFSAPRDQGEVEYIDRQVLVTVNEGSGTWGHWMVHNLPKIALCLERFPGISVAVPASYMSVDAYKNFGALLDLFAVPRDRIVPIRHHKKYKLRSVVLVDFLYSDSAVHPYVPALFDEAVAKMRAPCHSGGSDGTRMFIERTAKGRREIANQPELIGALEGYGFKPRRLGDEPLFAQAAAWGVSEAVCCVLGSDFTNILFGQPGTELVVLTPRWFGDRFFYDLAAAKGMVWNELVCGEMSTRREPSHAADFAVELDVARRFLEGVFAPDAAARRHA